MTRKAPRRGSRLKRWRAAALIERWLPAVAAGYIRLVWTTTRWRVIGAEHRREAQLGGAVIAAFWHGRVFLSPLLAPEGRRTSAIISNNRDGDIIAGAAERLGVRPIRGSTRHPGKRDRDKGGREAYAGGMQALGAGDVLAITPDGPRGPRMRAQNGVAALSAHGRAPVLPLSLSTRRGRFLGTWDRFLWPWPFDSGVLIYGPLIPAPASTDEAAIAAHRLRIEAALTELTERADREMGRKAVTPDPPAAEPLSPELVAPAPGQHEPVQPAFGQYEPGQPEPVRPEPVQPERADAAASSPSAPAPRGPSPP